MSYPIDSFRPRKNPKDYKTLNHLMEKAQKTADDCEVQFLLNDDERVLIASTIIGWIDLFEDCLISESAIPRIVETGCIYGPLEQEVLFIREVALSSWYQIVESKIQHGFFQILYAKHCDPETFTQLLTTFSQLSFKKTEMLRLLKNRDIQNLINFFRNLLVPIFSLQQEIEKMVLDSDFTEEDKVKNIVRIKETANEIFQIIDLITENMSLTTSAQHEVMEIVLPTTKLYPSIDE